MAKMRREANFTAMLVGLMIALVIGPILLELDLYLRGLSIQSVLAITLVVSIWSAIDSKLWFFGGIALATFNAAITVTDLFFTNFFIDVLGLFTTFLFCTLSIAFVMFHLFEEGGRYEISGNRLVGAVSIYLLLGIGFGVLNMLIEATLPGSFKGLDPDNNGSAGIDMIYFSFVTMTTLGYGDVTPIRPLAQAAAYIGAVIGQFYIAVLVAGLVGSYVSQQIAKRSEQ